jgi:hypothetical protein
VLDAGRFPDFFLIGQPKSGSTALYELLRRHPGIFMPDVKEPMYFAGEDCYSGAPYRLNDYLALFSPVTANEICGEASILYLWSPSAAERIAAVRPDARLIVMLREPVSFLRSLHLQFVQNHFELEGEFSRAMTAEDARRAGVHDPRSVLASPELLVYSEHVRYMQQLDRYLRHFDRDQLLVLIYDDFRRDNEATLRRVLEFLGRDDVRAQPEGGGMFNPSIRVRSTRLHHMLRRVRMGDGPGARRTKEILTTVVPSRSLRAAVWRAIEARLFSEPKPLDSGFADDLRRRFKPEVEALSDFLHRDLVGEWGYRGAE